MKRTQMITSKFYIDKVRPSGLALLVLTARHW